MTFSSSVRPAEFVHEISNLSPGPKWCQRGHGYLQLISNMENHNIHPVQSSHKVHQKAASMLHKTRPVNTSGSITSSKLTGHTALRRTFPRPRAVGGPGSGATLIAIFASAVAKIVAGAWEKGSATQRATASRPRAARCENIFVFLLCATRFSCRSQFSWKRLVCMQNQRRVAKTRNSNRIPFCFCSSF